jgi:hypothetical protein
VYRQIERADLTLNWINLAILGIITLIPLPAGVLAADFDGTSLADQRTVVVLCAAIAFFATAAWIPLFRHLQRHPDRLKEATRQTASPARSSGQRSVSRATSPARHAAGSSTAYRRGDLRPHRRLLRRHEHRYPDPPAAGGLHVGGWQR